MGLSNRWLPISRHLLGASVYALHCTALHCTRANALHCTVLKCATLCCNALSCTALWQQPHKQLWNFFWHTEDISAQRESTRKCHLYFWNSHHIGFCLWNIKVSLLFLDTFMKNSGNGAGHWTLFVGIWKLHSYSELFQHKYKKRNLNMF